MGYGLGALDLGHRAGQSGEGKPETGKENMNANTVNEIQKIEMGLINL